MKNEKKIPLKIQKIIQKFIVEINNILGKRVKKIILYGSYARGDFNKHSDIDIMILTDLENEEWYKYFQKISDIAYDIEADNNFEITLSPVLKNEKNFNYWLEALPFYINIQKEGVVLSESKNI